MFQSTVPWRKVCDYLAEIGTENELSTFCDKAHLDPFKTEVPLAGYPSIANWSLFRHTEFVADFLKPQGIHYSMAVPVFAGYSIHNCFSLKRLPVNREKLERH